MGIRGDPGLDGLSSGSAGCSERAANARAREGSSRGTSSRVFVSQPRGRCPGAYHLLIHRSTASRRRVRAGGLSSLAAAGASTYLVLSRSCNLGVNVVTEQAQPWFFWLSWCDEPTAPWTNIRLPPGDTEILAMMQPAILESWTPRTRFGAWVYGSRTRRFRTEQALRGRFHRLVDFAVVQAVHAAFSSLGEETRGSTMLIPMECDGTLPLSRAEIDMLEERIRRCPEAAESYITKIVIDMDFVLTLCRRPFPDSGAEACT
ncbi:hypothetical protein ENSA7_02990 [Enhygromyxa salina]|uniref:Uncharacterized protein n=1 Tax=Enhygromyxa salina TaxID=215803 RepID=A0A2S9YYC7_9BACT|nr:hypothetical protein ENSA7_02990 [Enhygromyxa salina]